MGKLKQGYIQIYTGNGKGKSTAVIGQAIRAAGFGLKTYMLQIMKDFPYNENNILDNLKEFIEYKKICKDDWVFKKLPAPEKEKIIARNALIEVEEKMLSGKYDLIILDEVCVSIYFGLITIEEVMPIIKNKPKNVELILTGRYAQKEFIGLADLVTEMKEVKHYYQNGVKSRRGIES